jgi:hypothetical protein
LFSAGGAGPAGTHGIRGEGKSVQVTGTIRSVLSRFPRPAYRGLTPAALIQFEPGHDNEDSIRHQRRGVRAVNRWVVHGLSEEVAGIGLRLVLRREVLSGCEPHAV